MKMFRTFWTAEDTAMAHTLTRQLGRLLWRSLGYFAALLGGLSIASLIAAWFALHCYVSWPVLVVLLIVDVLTLGVIVVKCAVSDQRMKHLDAQQRDADRLQRIAAREQQRVKHQWHLSPKEPTS